MLAVNPLLPTAHRHLVIASEKLDDPMRAIGSYRALLEMEPVDPAETHYRLARILQKTGDLEAARRKVLESLEEAPRFRAALGLLLQIERSSVKPP